jgi:HK97 family phage major capsid protein
LTINAQAIKESLDTIQASTAEAIETIGGVKSEVKDLMARTDKLEAVNKRPGSRQADNDNSDIKAEHGAVALFARTGDDSKLKAIQASMSVGSDPDGGYLVLPAVSTGMTRKLYDTTPMRRLARVETITAGTDWVEPIDKTESGAAWVGEKSPRTDTGSPQLAEFRVALNEIFALQTVTQRLIDDSGFDVGAWIDGKVTDKFGRTEGTAFVTGDGVGKPQGFLSRNIVAISDATRAWGDLQYFASGGVTTITADGLKDAVWGLRAPYRAGSSWLMNSNSANAIDKLKASGTGEYVWRDGMQAGSPPSLLGYPVEFDENMPDIAAGSNSIAFGNFKLAYVIVDRAGIRFLRDPFTSKPNLLFYAYRRVGGNLANSEALKIVKTGTS